MRLSIALAALFLAACQPAPKLVEPAAPPVDPLHAIPAQPEGDSPSVPDILAASKPEEWRALDPENTLYMDFPQKDGKLGRVIIELAPDFAPNHVANIKALSREGYFAKGAVTRVQDNYVTQWAQAADPERPPKTGQKTLKAEFTRPRDTSIAFDNLPDPDTYAPEVGFSNGFPVARDDKSMWLVHCYGMVGAGRDNGDDTGGGTELYAINGVPPRGLDRNLSVVGRVVQGMELLSALPRGTEALGFYKTPAEYHRFTDIKVAADVPANKRTNLETLRTNSETFAKLVNSRRWRKDAFYHVPAGRIGLCNINVPVREMKK
ncbi:MAG TPA: peptidylprolyl isomerase [Hyphomonadaceae bacterium]|nr:peptidylprolyl isomerase [Hyphomonadaceae bacterium]